MDTTNNGNTEAKQIENENKIGFLEQSLIKYANGVKGYWSKLHIPRINANFYHNMDLSLDDFNIGVHGITDVKSTKINIKTKKFKASKRNSETGFITRELTIVVEGKNIGTITLFGNQNWDKMEVE